MKVLWLTWKDGSHPLAGGAEVVNEELAKRLVVHGHEVTFLVGGYHGCIQKEVRDGYSIVRVGGRFSVYWHAYRYYKKHLQQWPDLVVDEVNTIPFFARVYVTQKNVLFVHQLAREVWFYQMVFPLSLVGYLLEPLYMRLLAYNSRKHTHPQVVTVSDSTKQDLVGCGFAPSNIHIISEGVQLTPVPTLAEVRKNANPTVLALGSVRPMKRTSDIVRAFELAKKNIPTLELVIAGDTTGAYGTRVLQQINSSEYKNSIQCIGTVSDSVKATLMQQAHVLAVASVKEGWGLVVTEANSQGTPAVVYNTSGLRDSVQHGVTGLVTATNTPQGLATALVTLLQNQQTYQQLQQAAWEWSKQITFDKGYKEFIKILNKI